MAKTQNRLVGAHLSASGGLDKAVERAININANCLQLFSGSPRVWARKPLAEQNTDKLFSIIQNNSFGPVITHSLYLVNLASENPASVEKSIAGLQYDMAFDAHIKGSGIVVHLGSHQGRGWLAVREQVAFAIGQILSASPTEATFLIENSAGQNGKLCSDLADIRWLLDRLQSSQVGWCFDTCHASSAGYSLGAATHEATKPELQRHLTAQQAIEEYNLWSDLKCIHVNDSRDPFGSGKDRHANLGEGSVLNEDFEYFLNLKETLNLPLILEVPGLDGLGPDAENVKRLQKLVAE
jgi:deoxyribonuclease IV